MDSSISKACQELCRQAAVEHDPARLLALFLQIDRLVDQGGPSCADGGLRTTDLAILSVVCSHCYAIIELQDLRTTGKLLKCPWCSEPFSNRKVISGSEYESERPGGAPSHYVNRTSSE